MPGIKGMKWGVQNGPPYPIRAHYSSPKDMSDDMKSFKYTEFTTLQTPKVTAKKRSGSCHDQVMYEVDQLKRMGFKPETTFVFEHDGKGKVSAMALRLTGATNLGMYLSKALVL